MSLPRRTAGCLLASLALLGTAGGCGEPAAVDTSLRVDGEVSLLHHVPGGAPRPLVVVLHGLGSSADEMRRMTGLSAFAERNGFSVVYPDAHRVPVPVPVPVPPTNGPTPGPTPAPSTPPAPSSTPTPSTTPSPSADPGPSGEPTPDVEPTPTTSDPIVDPGSGPDPDAARLQQRRALARTVNEVAGGGPSSSRAWNAGRACCGGAVGDDVTYLRHVVTAVAARTPVDRRRIYVFGLSNGGMMATRAVCDAADLFAAAATVAGPYLGGRCVRPIWKHLHGGNDPVVPYRGGTSPGVVKLGVATDWCRCSFPSSATEATRVGGYVSVTLVPTGGHSWPTSRSPWKLDGNAALWQAVSVFRH